MSPERPAPSPEHPSTPPPEGEAVRRDGAFGAKRRVFRKASTAPKLASDALDRQSRIALLAWKELGADAAKSFLNDHCAALDGRPIDLAVASERGFSAVAAELTARAARM